MKLMFLGPFGKNLNCSALCSYSDAAYLEGKILCKNTDELVSNPTAPQLSSVISDKLGKR